jgi:site-specific DNA-methyltransferase (adenine-specific)
VCDSYLKDYGGKKDQMHPFGYLISDVWTDIHRIRHAKRRDEHPCQLPIPLLERLILMTTDVGDVVLDPFLGTGTTAIAAKQLQRHYIGIELDPFYADIAQGKLDKITKPTLYRNHPVSMYLGNIQSIRDCDAAELFPKQLTSTEKKRRKATIASNGHSEPKALELELPF